MASLFSFRKTIQAVNNTTIKKSPVQEEKKNTVLNACFDMFFSGDIVQNIFSELASKGDNKAFRAIRSYGIKIGKIQYSKI